jgi:hypothetical protein
MKIWPVHRHTGSPRLTGRAAKPGGFSLQRNGADDNPSYSAHSHEQGLTEDYSNLQPPTFQVGALPLSYIRVKMVSPAGLAPAAFSFAN